MRGPIEMGPLGPLGRSASVAQGWAAGRPGARPPGHPAPGRSAETLWSPPSGMHKASRPG